MTTPATPAPAPAPASLADRLYGGTTPATPAPPPVDSRGFPTSATVQATEKAAKPTTAADRLYSSPVENDNGIDSDALSYAHALRERGALDSSQARQVARTLQRDFVGIPWHGFSDSGGMMSGVLRDALIRMDAEKVDKARAAIVRSLESAGFKDTRAAMVLAAEALASRPALRTAVAGTVAEFRPDFVVTMAKLGERNRIAKR